MRGIDAKTERSSDGKTGPTIANKHVQKGEKKRMKKEEEEKRRGREENKTREIGRDSSIARKRIDGMEMKADQMTVETLLMLRDNRSEKGIYKKEERK